MKVVEVTKDNIKEVLPTGYCYSAYLLVGHDDEVLYVGKAAQTRNRLMNHFKGQSHTKSFHTSIQRAIAVLTHERELAEYALTNIYSPTFNKHRLIGLHDRLDGNELFQNALEDINRLLRKDSQMELNI